MPFAAAELQAVAAMRREAERFERLATVVRWSRYVPLESFDAADRALLAWHRRLERSLRAYQLERGARARAARRAEYAAWDSAMQHEQATCPACAP